MGYKLPDGRYVDDRGKTHKNYNDALAESRTLSRRDLEQRMLGQSNESLAQAQNNLEIARREKGLLGWIPGMGAYYDRALRQYANDAAYAETAVGARAQQLAATNARMGIGSPRASSDGGLEPAAKPQPKNLPPALSDDADVRASEARRMLQQATPFWEREENKNLLQAAQVGGGPRAGEAGYAQRADIAAWIEANKNAPKGVDGKNIVDRFLEKQRRQGLLDTPEQAPSMGGTRITMPVDAESAAQAGRSGLVGFEGNALEQAQASVSEIQGRERAAMSQKIWQAAAEGKLPEVVASPFDGGTPDWAQSAQAVANPAAFGEMGIAQPFSNPEFNRQYAALLQPVVAQSVATRKEPVDPADELARKYLQRAATQR